MSKTARELCKISRPFNKDDQQNVLNAFRPSSKKHWYEHHLFPSQFTGSLLYHLSRKLWNILLSSRLWPYSHPCQISELKEHWLPCIGNRKLYPTKEKRYILLSFHELKNHFSFVNNMLYKDNATTKRSIMSILAVFWSFSASQCHPYQSKLFTAP